MVEVTRESVPIAKGRPAFIAEVRNSVSKVANLTGWYREERDGAMGSVENNAAVAQQWRLLMRAAESGPLPVWEWNGYVRAATEAIVMAHYLR